MPFKGGEGRLQHPRRAPSSSKKGVFFNLEDGSLIWRRWIIFTKAIVS